LTIEINYNNVIVKYMATKVLNSIKTKSMAQMTVAEFERTNKTELRTVDKSMKLTEYFEKTGFPEFSRLIAG